VMHLEALYESLLLLPLLPLLLLLLLLLPLLFLLIESCSVFQCACFPVDVDVQLLHQRFGGRSGA